MYIIQSINGPSDCICVEFGVKYCCHYYYFVVVVVVVVVVTAAVLPAAVVLRPLPGIGRMG